MVILKRLEREWVKHIHSFHYNKRCLDKIIKTDLKMPTNEDINKKDVLAKVTPVIEEIARQQNLIVLEINFVKESGRWNLRIFIYSQDHSITHVDCENLTKSLGSYLDKLISVPFYFEVSSPGIERKLKSSLEYDIFKGQKVEIKLKQEQEGFKKFLAKIIEYNAAVGLKVQSIDSNKILEIKEENISSVKLKADF